MNIMIKWLFFVKNKIVLGFVVVIFGILSIFLYVVNFELGDFDVCFDFNFFYG